MMKRSNVITSIAIVITAAVFIGILTYGLMLDPKKIPAANIGQPAKPFHVAWVKGQESLPQAQGNMFSLSDFRGKPIILNFWASWCVSCRSEAAELEAFWKKHKNEIAVVGIAIQDDVDEARRFADYYGKTYFLGLDVDGRAAIDYGVSGVPETFIIDARGIIVHKEVGPVSAEMLSSLVNKTLNKS